MGAARIWGAGRAALCVDPGSSPRGTMESGEISSDYLINGLRLQEVAARISSKVESREDRGMWGDACGSGEVRWQHGI